MNWMFWKKKKDNKNELSLEAKTEMWKYLDYIRHYVYEHLTKKIPFDRKYLEEEWFFDDNLITGGYENMFVMNDTFEKQYEWDFPTGNIFLPVMDENDEYIRTMEVGIHITGNLIINTETNINTIGLKIKISNYTLYKKI